MFIVSVQPDYLYGCANKKVPCCPMARTGEKAGYEQEGRREKGVRGRERGQKEKVVEEGRHGGEEWLLFFGACASLNSGWPKRACRPVWLALAFTANTYVGRLKFIDAVAWHVVPGASFQCSGCACRLILV